MTAVAHDDGGAPTDRDHAIHVSIAPATGS